MIGNPRFEDIRRPFERTGLFRRVLPFAGVGALAGVLTANAPESSQPELVVAATGATFVVAVTMAAWLSTARLPGWLDVVPPLIAVLGIALIRHGGGGAASGVIPVYALVVVWVALYGTGRQIVIIVGAASLATVIPIVAFGPPQYPESEWRLAVIDGAIGLLVGLTVNQLVTRLRAAADLDRRRLAALAEAEARRQAMIEAANDAIVTVMGDGTIVDVNRAALELFGGDRPTLIGENLVTTLATEDERDLLRRALDQGMTDAGQSAARRVRVGFRRLDGAIVQAELSLGVVRDERGWTIHAFARDVTELVAVEGERERELNDLGALLAVGREMGRSEALGTVREAICAAALTVSDAAAVVLLEPHGRDFVVTSSAGRHVGLDRIGMQEQSVVATTFASGMPLFIGRIRGDSRVSARASAISGARAAYWQPIRAQSGSAGVLIAVWDQELETLAPRVERLLNIVASQAEVALELAALVERLESLAHLDPLTGLANRRTLDASLAAELDRASRSGCPLSLVMLDLDHFKAYNDQHGHPAGDALLVAAAQAWQRELRPSDVLVRYGGEEFTAVLPDCKRADALVVAERLRRAMPRGSTVSAGIATACAGEDPASLVARADAALYRAKQAGRDRTVAA